MASSLGGIIQTQLSGSRDTQHIITEILGIYTLGALKANSKALKQLQRRLFLQLTLLFNHQLSCVIRDQLSPSNATGCAQVDHDTAFSALLQVLHLGARIESPSILGKNNHELFRGLVLAAFLPALRLLCLQESSVLDHEERDVLRERTVELCRAWEAHQDGLSGMEDLVFVRLVPATLDEMGEGNDECLLRKATCGRVDGNELAQGELPHRRELLRSVAENLDGVTWVGAFWALFDMLWAVADGADWVTLGFATIERWGCFTYTLEFLNGFVSDAFPNNLTDCPRLRQKLLEDVAEFQKMLLARDERLSAQYTKVVPFPRQLEHDSSFRPGLFISRASSSRTQSDASPLESNFASPATDLTTPGTPVSPLFFKAPSLSSHGTDFSLPQPPREVISRPATASPSKRSLSLGVPPQPGYPAPLSPITGRTQHGHRDSIAWEGPSDLNNVSLAAHASQDATRCESSASCPVTLQVPALQVARGRKNSISVGLPKRSSVVSESAVTAQSLGYSDLQVVTDWTDPDMCLPEALPNQTQPKSPNSRTDTFYVDGMNPSLASLSLTATQPSIPEPVTLSPSPRSTSISSVSTTQSSVKAKSRLRSFFKSQPKSATASTTSVELLPGAPVRDELDFRFSTAGTSLLLWPLRNPSHIVRIPYPFREGQRLPLRSPYGDGPISVRLVEGGTASVAAILFESGSKLAKLVFFLGLGPGQQAPRCEATLEHLEVGAAPTSLAVSRDDTMVAVGCGSKVLLYAVDFVSGELTLSLTHALPAHARCGDLPADGRRIQRVNFSVGSDALVVATQECGDAHRFPVYVRLWTCGRGRMAKHDMDLEPVSLSLGYSGDSGLSGIFIHIDHTNPSNSRVFLTARATKSYPAILPLTSTTTSHSSGPHRSGKRHHIDLAEVQIDSAAQCATASGQFAFRNGRHRVCRVDLRSGHVSPAANFATERAGLKVQHEAMALGLPPGGSVAYAFWRSSAGDLVLKELGASSGQSLVHGVRLNEVWWAVMNSRSGSEWV